MFQKNIYPSFVNFYTNDLFSKIANDFKNFNETFFITFREVVKNIRSNKSLIRTRVLFHVPVL